MADDDAVRICDAIAAFNSPPRSIQPPGPPPPPGALPPMPGAAPPSAQRRRRPGTRVFVVAGPARRRQDHARGARRPVHEGLSSR